jgi:hypothetical protein
MGVMDEKNLRAAGVLRLLSGLIGSPVGLRVDGGGEQRPGGTEGDAGERAG